MTTSIPLHSLDIITFYALLDKDFLFALFDKRSGVVFLQKSGELIGEIDGGAVGAAYDDLLHVIF